MKLAGRIFIGLVVGIVAGIFCNQYKDTQVVKDIIKYVAPFGHIFLNLIFMIVIPLIFSAIVVSVAEFRDIGTLGRIGLKTLIVTIVLAGISVAVGLSVTNLLKPGEGFDPKERENLTKMMEESAKEKTAKAKEAKPITDVIIGIIPKNPLKSLVEGDYLALMFFALIFGIAVALCNPDRTQNLVSVLQAVFEVCLKIITFAMALAPFAVALLVFPVATEIGLRILETLGKFMVVVILGLAFHMFVVYSIVLSVFVKMNPFVFFKKIREVMLTAFATSSSNATLPVSLKVGEENLKIPKEINRFVLTVGATANQNGTALYEGVTILFLAQVFGANLSIENQLMVILMTILAGIGTAGVPGGSLPYIAMILTMVGIPGERIALILGVDRILDMCRTVLNVTGDLVVAAYVASSEGKLVVEET